MDCNTHVERKSDMEDKKARLQIAWNTIERQYGIILGGFLKTRFVQRNNNNCGRKFIFPFKSSWKLRYWRLGLTDEGLVFEKSRRADTKPYKGMVLLFGETSFWENWGKRGDKNYRFGFTIRVASTNTQIEVAVNSERIRRQWMNVLNSVFHDNVRNTKDLLNCLAMTSSIKTQSTKTKCELKKRTSKDCGVSRSSVSWDEMVSPVIPRRFPADMYDDDGNMSDYLKSVHSDCRRTTLSSRRWSKEFEWQDYNKDVSHKNNLTLKTNEINSQFFTDYVNDQNNGLLSEGAAPRSDDSADGIVFTSARDVYSESNSSTLHSDSICSSQPNLDSSNERSPKSQTSSNCSLEEKQQMISPMSDSFTLRKNGSIVADNDNRNVDAHLILGKSELEERRNPN